MREKGTKSTKFFTECRNGVRLVHFCMRITAGI